MLVMQNKMFDHDALMQKLGGVLVATEKGTATAELIIREDHLQGHGTCNGAVIFALADAVFAVACNGGEYPAVGQHCNISYLKPAKLGDTLTAHAALRAEAGRTEIYDVSIQNQQQQLVAEFRGISRILVPRG